MARRPNVTPFPPPTRRPWFPRLATDDRGRVIANFDNVMIALRAEEQLQFAVAYDEMVQHSIVTRQWPRVDEADPAPRPAPHEVDDDDVAGLHQWLQRSGIARVGRETVGQAIEHFARESPQHPIRDQLADLKWDGTPRLDTWLFVYFGACADTDSEIEYVRAIGRMFLIAMVARVMDPGCQADYMLVLEGAQGTLKSSACRILAGEEWFSSHLPESISSKDASQHLRGKWLIEVSELAAFSKAEVETLKAFITRREEKYRPPFGRHDVTEKRQCLFVGTTNQDVYIKDATGGRRFWPVRCTTIDIPGLEKFRDQLLAEAVVAHRNKEPHWPDVNFEAAHFRPQQLLRQEDDPWLTVIFDTLKAGGLAYDFTVSDVARVALQFDAHARVGTADARRISTVLKDLGCTQRRTKHGRFYSKAAESDDG